MKGCHNTSTDGPVTGNCRLYDRLLCGNKRCWMRPIKGEFRGVVFFSSSSERDTQNFNDRETRANWWSSEIWTKITLQRTLSLDTKLNQNNTFLLYTHKIKYFALLNYCIQPLMHMKICMCFLVLAKGTLFTESWLIFDVLGEEEMPTPLREIRGTSQITHN